MPNSNLIAEWSAELKLLVEVIRDQHDGAALTGASVGDFNWQKFVDLAEYHRVEGLVALNLASHENAEIPLPIRQKFDSDRRQRAIHSMANTRATLEICGALQNSAIPCMVMKGQAVSTRYYTVPTSRQSIDIDILIDEDHLADAQIIVGNLGFKQFYPDFPIPSGCEDVFRTFACDIAFIRSDDGAKLELHWRLFRNRHLLNWNAARIRDLSTEMQLAGGEVRVMQPAAQLLYLICHGSKHAWFRLKWAADIHRMLRTFTGEDIKQLMLLSEEAGTMRMLATSLQLIRGIFGEQTPALNQAELTPHEDPHLLRYLLKSIVSTVDRKTIWMADIGNVVALYRYLSRLRSGYFYKRFVTAAYFINVRDINSLRLSKKWLWLYVLLGPIIRVFRVGSRGFRSRSQPK